MRVFEFEKQQLDINDYTKELITNDTLCCVGVYFH